MASPVDSRNNAKQFVRHCLTEQVRIAKFVSDKLNQDIVVYSTNPYWNTAPVHTTCNYRYKQYDKQYAVLSVAAQDTFKTPVQYSQYAPSGLTLTDTDAICPRTKQK